MAAKKKTSAKSAQAKRSTAKKAPAKKQAAAPTPRRGERGGSGFGPVRV